MENNNFSLFIPVPGNSLNNPQYILNQEKLLKFLQDMKTICLHNFELVRENEILKSENWKLRKENEILKLEHGLAKHENERIRRKYEIVRERLLHIEKNKTTF